MASKIGCAGLRGEDGGAGVALADAQACRDCLTSSWVFYPK